MFDMVMMGSLLGGDDLGGDGNDAGGATGYSFKGILLSRVMASALTRHL